MRQRSLSGGSPGQHRALAWQCLSPPLTTASWIRTDRPRLILWRWRESRAAVGDFGCECECVCECVAGGTSAPELLALYWSSLLAVATVRCDGLVLGRAVTPRGPARPAGRLVGSDSSRTHHRTRYNRRPVEHAEQPTKRHCAHSHKQQHTLTKHLHTQTHPQAKNEHRRLHRRARRRGEHSALAGSARVLACAALPWQSTTTMLGRQPDRAPLRCSFARSLLA